MPAPARAREERMRDHGGVCALWSWVVLHRAVAGGSGLLGLPLCGLLGLHCAALSGRLLRRVAGRLRCMEARRSNRELLFGGLARLLLTAVRAEEMRSCADEVTSHAG